MEIIVNEILDLVKKKMRENGSYGRDAYKQYVGETIDYFVEKGKLTVDDNLEFTENRLMDMYGATEEKMGEE